MFWKKEEKCSICATMKVQTGKRRLSPPYEMLHVYLLAGIVETADEQTLGPHFIGNWVEGKNSFLFFCEPSRDTVMALLDRKPGLELVEEFQIDYDQWQGGPLGSIEVAGFVIRPYWHQDDECKAASDMQEILLDPGVVFGNGLHPTTQDCLRALRWLMGSKEITNVLDLGTGTGILAIASALMGTKEVLAVDLNPLCVRTAEKNVQLNGVEDTVRVIEGNAYDFADVDADLIVANLDYDVISELLRKKEFTYKRWYIFSGLMRTPCAELKSLLKEYGMEVEKQWDHEMTWFTIACKGRCKGKALGLGY